MQNLNSGNMWDDIYIDKEVLIKCKSKCKQTLFLEHSASEIKNKESRSHQISQNTQQSNILIVNSWDYPLTVQSKHTLSIKCLTFWFNLPWTGWWIYWWLTDTRIKNDTRQDECFSVSHVSYSFFYFWQCIEMIHTSVKRWVWSKDVNHFKPWPLEGKSSAMSY